MPDIQGGCLCGAIRYHSEAEPVLTAIYNCKNCQRQSGTAFSVVVGLPKDSIVMDAAEPATFHDTGETGLAVRRRFCSGCGSPIFSEVDSTPDLDYLKAGTLDDTSWLEPKLNIWCDSEQSWLRDDLAAVRIPRNPPHGLMAVHLRTNIPEWPFAKRIFELVELGDSCPTWPTQGLWAAVG